MQISWRKIVKITLGTLLGLALLFVIVLGSFIYYLRTDSGKDWLTLKLNNLLTKELGVAVKIDLAELHLPGTFHLHHVLIRDHHNNEILRSELLSAEFDYYNFISKKITLGRVDIENGNFYLTRYKGEEKTNVGQIISRLEGGPSTGSSKTDVLIKYIVISNGHFVYEEQNKAPITHDGVDWNHINIKDLNAKVSYLALKGPNIALNVQTMDFNDKSGFVLNELRTRMTYTKQQMEFTGLYLKTPESEISDYLRFDYKHPRNFDDFIDSVDVEAHFINTKSSFKDIAFFTYQLENKKDPFILNSANVTGRINKLRIADLDAAFGNSSYLKGKVSLRGLPNTNETFIDARVNSSKTSYTELTKFLPELPVPEEVDKFGNIELNGNFTGFLNDFVAYGTAKTALGTVVTDINLKLNKNQALSTYSGNVKTQNFNIGKLLSEPVLGLVSMNGKVSGTGFTKESVNANLSSIFQQIDIWGYSYKNLTVNGDIKKQFFNGKLTARDANLDLDFAGSIDFNHAKPIYNFVTDIRKANLRGLGFTKDTVIFSSLVDLNMRGNNLDDIEGKALTYKTKLITPNRTYDFDTLTLNSIIDSNFRKITVKSDLLNGSLAGNYKLSEIDDLLKTTANRYIDSTFLRLDGKMVQNQSVDFDIQFRDMEAVFHMLNSPVILQDSGYMRGAIRSDDGFVKLEGFLPKIIYKNLVFNHIQLDGLSRQNNILDLSVGASSFGTIDSTYLRNVTVNTSTNNDKLTFYTYAADVTLKKQLELKGTLDIIEHEALLALDTSLLLLGDTSWKISAKPITIYSDTLVDVPLLVLANGAQQLKIIGKYSPKTSYPIRVVVEEFGIPVIASFVPQIKSLGGNLNGQILVNNLNTQKPIVEAALFASSLTYDKDTLGTFTTTTSYNEETRLLTVEASLENGNQEKTLETFGTIGFKNKQALDFLASLNRTDLRIFEPFIGGVFTDLAGTATADMKITGTLADPVFRGNISLQNAALTVDYLKTRYRFNHDAAFNGNFIVLKDLRLYDDRNNEAELNGKIDLSNLNDIGLSLEIVAENFHVLNTTLQENELYYGEAFASGYVSINGPLSNLRMYIKMRTEKGTRFYLPISEASSFTGYKYIKFIDRKNFLKEKRNIKVTGLKLTMDLDVTPDAVAQIIFDPRVGDLIEGRGEGNIRMDINTEGDFSMYGLYTITQGKYLFTAYDVINKSFTIKPGGTINWRGSPYDANLNLQAVYNVRTTLGPLLDQQAAKTETIDVTRRYPVEAQLNLTGPLFSPNIKLGFEIQELTAGGTGAWVESVLGTIKNNEQEMSKQVVSLLVLNQFAPVQQGQGLSGNVIGEGINSSIGDLVSSQINYYLSQIVQDVQVGVDYTPTSQQDQPDVIQQKDALTLRVSTNLFDERANVDVGYDVNNNNHNAQVSYKLQENGNVRAKVFSRSNNSALRQSSNTIGIGLFFRREFNSFGELFKKKKNTNSKDF
ncbi:MAG: translocation/assembly module TamB [Sphingobacteriales bacterium]|nr:MAG: translocation/assembly module TamB [Sphingobacteriales bacterium]